MKGSRGFSLAEMMAVIAVLGILAVLLLPNVLGAYKDAKKGVLLDEAKSVYAEAINKYATEKAEGKVVSVLTDAETTDDNTYTLDLTNDGVEYFVRLDAHGEVISLVVIDGDYCIYGSGDFLDTAKRSDVEDLYKPDGSLNENCAKSNQAGLYAKVLLYSDNVQDLNLVYTPHGDNTTTSDAERYSVFYYYYGQGWYYQTESGEKEPLVKLNNRPNPKDKVFTKYVARSQNNKEFDVINEEGVLSNSQETIALLKSGDYCEKPWNNNMKFDECEIHLHAKYRPLQVNLKFNGSEPEVKGTQKDIVLHDGEKIKLPGSDETAEPVEFTYRGYRFGGWAAGSKDGELVPNALEYSQKIYKTGADRPTSEPEAPTDNSDINLFAKWIPDTIEASDVICVPDSDNYCSKPVYYKFGGKMFVLYRITNEGYKAILDGVEGPYSYLQTDCCNHGNCYYTSVNYTRSQLAQRLNGTWLTGMNKDRLVNASWYSGYKNNELLNIETARVGILNYAEYLHTNGRSYSFVYEHALVNGSSVWWWTMTPTTNQPYYYDGQYYLANVILRYNASTKVVDYDEMTVNGTVVGTNHIYGANDKAYYRPVVVFKPKTPIKSGWGTYNNPFVIE